VASGPEPLIERLASGQYAVILDVVTARTAESRAAHLRKAVTALEARGAGERGSGA
jgi:hypothetical protein